jgi:hypothetical protein
MKRESQNKQLERWLKSGKTISPLQALSQMGIYRLASRINELRNPPTSLDIQTKLINEHPIHYAQYSLNRKRK